MGCPAGQGRRKEPPSACAGVLGKERGSACPVSRMELVGGPGRGDWRREQDSMLGTDRPTAARGVRAQLPVPCLHLPPTSPPVRPVGVKEMQAGTLSLVPGAPGRRKSQVRESFGVVGQTPASSTFRAGHRADLTCLC